MSSSALPVLATRYVGGREAEMTLQPPLSVTPTKPCSQLETGTRTGGKSVSHSHWQEEEEPAGEKAEREHGLNCDYGNTVLRQ